MRQLTSFDLYHLVKDLDIEGAKFDKIYISDDGELLITIHIPGRGKKILRAAPPNFFYMTDLKEEMPERLKGFAQYLRKHLPSARIREIRQAGFERILDIALSSREGNYHLIIELFGRGNAMLCSEDYTIMSAMEQKIWSSRDIRTGKPYIFPDRPNPVTIDEAGFTKVFMESSMTSAVKAIAVEFGLGGTYAEEVCLRAGIDKNKKDEPGKAFKALKQLMDEKPQPMLIMEKGAIIDYAPVSLLQNKDREQMPLERFNDVIDRIATAGITTREQDRKHKGKNKEIERLKKIIASQEALISNALSEADMQQKKGEAIYENYQLLSDILKELRKARATHSLREIKQKLKGHKLIKSLNEEKKEFTVQLTRA